MRVSAFGSMVSLLAIVGCAPATREGAPRQPVAGDGRSHRYLPPPTWPEPPPPPYDPSATAIAFAEAQLGKRYCWGGTGPNCFDCSGLVQSAWRAAGARLPRTTDDQARALVSVPLGEVRPGDILWWSHGHVGLYVGNGTIIDAYHSGAGVVRRRAPLPDLVLRVTAYEPDASSSRQPGSRPRSTSHRRSSP